VSPSPRYIGERGRGFIREAKPLFDSSLILYTFRVAGERFERGAKPPSYLYPPSLNKNKREGGQGDRFLKF
jgi:hypothetical protein